VTFSNNAELSVEAVIINPSGFESVPMPVGSAITCALGREFRVTAKGDTRWFKTWYAPDTLIAGSPATSETFILGNSSQQVGPGKRSESTVTIGDNVDWTGVGPLADEIWTSQDGLGRTVLHVAEGTYVGVSLAESAPEPDPCPFDLASSWKLSVDGEMSYRTSLTVRGGDVQLAQECGKTPTWTHALSGDGGVLPFGLQENPSGDIQGYIIGAVTDHGPWPDSQTFNQDFVTEFQVQPGFQLETISLPGEGTQCADDIPSLFVQGGVTAHATLATGPGGTTASTEKKSTLTVICVTKPGDEPGGSFNAYKGSGSTWTAVGKFVTRVTSCHPDTELIRLTANPQNGFRFVRWKGDGDWMDEAGNVNPYGLRLDASDRDYEHWVYYPTIYVKCEADRTLTAEFRRQAIVYERDTGYLGWLFRTDAPGALSALHYEVYSANDDTSTSEIIAQMKYSMVYVYSGHESGNIPVEQINLSGTDYKLVFCNSCESGAGSKPQLWMTTLNADSFVGWIGLASEWYASRFDSKFWSKTQAGMSVVSAAYEAADELGYDTNDPNHPIWVGDATL